MSHSADPDFEPSDAASIESSEEGGEDARLEDWQVEEESEDFSEDAAHEDAEALARSLSNDMVLKLDHHNRPLWVCRDGRIFVETSSPFYDKAYDFLTTVAEPVSRPECIHEYRLTPQSLYTAVSVGLDPQTILRVLGMLSKGKELDHAVVELVERCTASHGSAKLVLKQGRFWVQTADQQVLDKLLAHPVIRAAQVAATPGADARGVVCRAAVTEHEAAHLVNLTQEAAAGSAGGGGPGEDGTAYQGVQEDAGQTVMAFEIHPSQVANVKRACMPGQAGLNCPLLEEYDFAHDTVNQTLDIELGRDVCLRPHQQKSLRKLFGNGRARSGVIVLPCGAGKTLVGVAAAARVKKATLVLCNSSVSMDQWVQQFNLWTDVDPDQVVKFSSDDGDQRSANLERLQRPCVCVTTFSMIAYKGDRSAYSEQMMQLLSSREWGLLVLDEVHEVPANTFSKAIGDVKAHCKLGLTATPVREDDKIGDLSFLIGPKMYEADWMDLTRCGYIAKVDCYEMRCPMTREFDGQYRDNSQHNGLRQLLSVMNPNKFVACQHLINHHEMHGDKVIVFCDNIWALEHYARALGRPCIRGSTSNDERALCLDNFKAAQAGVTLFLSKVGDTSLDIPEANVLIQISGHGGSRRQEAQRLGRILRVKKGQQESHAIFYTLVSEGTKEMQYSGKRQQFLVNQGFTYKVVSHTAAAGQPQEAQEEAQEAQGAQAPYPQPQAQQLQPQPQSGLALKYSTAEEQQLLLQKVLDSVADRSPDGRNGAERGVEEGVDSSQLPAKMRRQGSAADAEQRARVRRMRRDLMGSRQ